MMTRIHDRFARTAALIALTTAACDDGSGFDASHGGVELRDGTGQSGPVFNTNKIYTSDVSTIDTGGQPVNGVTLIGVQVLDAAAQVQLSVATMYVELGTLVGSDGNNNTYTGEDFIGSVWTYDLGGGQQVTAVLTTVETADDAGLYDPLSPSQIRLLDPERLVYTFHFLHPVTQQPILTCAEDDIAGARMVLYGDIAVDHTTGDITSQAHRIYFGCISGAIGKAALWGYAPDSPSLPSLSMPAFETATRVVRADYCANGQSYTEVGKELTLADRWGINSHGAIPFRTEAIWEVGGGAKCLRRIRESGKVLAASLQCPGGATIPLCSLDEGAVQSRWNSQYGDIWTRIPSP